MVKQMFNELPASKRMTKVRNLINQSWAINPANFVNIDKYIRTELTENVKNGSLALTGTKTKEQLANELSSNDVTEAAIAQENDSKNKKPEGQDVNSNNIDTKAGIGDNIVGKIPSDQPLFSDRRYIRVALAFTILEMQPGTSSKIPIICQDGTTVSPLYINWQDTICKGYKHMYSIDSNTLYIPNKHHPRFRIEGAFLDPIQEIKDGKETVKAFTNPIPNLLIQTKDGVVFNEKANDTIVDMHPNPHGHENKIEGAKNTYCHFPSNEALEFSNQADGDSSFEVTEANADEWGFLRNLYIDFDFFIQTIQQNSYLTKDVMYTLLNGLSGGVNMMWDFQIVEQCSIDYNESTTKNGNQDDEFYQWYAYVQREAKGETGPTPGQEELAVVDLNFFGKQSAVPSLGKAGFQSRGTKSPFLSANLTFNIPAAMKGQIVAQRQSGGNTDNPNLEQVPKNFKAENKSKLFSTYRDTIADKIYHFNSFDKETGEGGAGGIAQNEQEEQEKLRQDHDNDKEYTEALEAESRPWYKSVAKWAVDTYDSAGVSLGITEPKNIKEARNANYEMVLGNANIAPYIQDREASLDVIQGFFDGYKGNNATLDEIARVTCWRDSEILQIITKFDAFEQYSKSKQHSVMLPIEFEFETPGVSGLKMGDTFTITDLPKPEYSKKFFQITEVTHQIEQSIWKTKVKGALRNETSGHDPEKTVDEMLEEYIDKIFYTDK